MQATTPPTDASKSSWRKFFQTRLTANPPSDSETQALRHLLYDAIHNHPPQHIACFAAIRAEPDLFPLIEALPHHHWHFPRVIDSFLTFHPIRQQNQLVTGSFGILEPSPDAPITPVEQLDLILCPGLGFGRDHSRLGRGRGYYDRLLASKRPDARTIGLAYDPQIVDHVPTEAHDIPLDYLLTPSGWIGPELTPTQ